MTRSGWLRRCAVGALALLLMVVFTSGIARAGSAYTYCTMMGTIGEAPCCAHGHADRSSAPAARAAHLECCKRATAPLLPSAQSSPPRLEAPVAPLLAVLPSVASLSALVRAIETPHTWRMHEHPPDARTRAEARAQLMVFLT